MGDKWDEISIFHSPILPIFPAHRTYRRQRGNFWRSLTLTAAGADACSDEHHGYKPKAEGNAFMIALGNTADACKFCIALQGLCACMATKGAWPKQVGR